MSNFRIIKRKIIYRFFKERQNNANVHLRYEENLYRLFFLVFVSDFVTTIPKLKWKTGKMENYFKQNRARYEELYDKILQVWSENDTFITPDEIPFDMNQFQDYIIIDNLVFNLSRFRKINTIVYDFLKESYHCDLDAEWNKAFYAMVSYYFLFNQLEGWKKHKTDEYDYHAFLHVRIFLINIFSRNLQLILKDKFNDIFLLFNELFPCKLYIS